MVLVYPDESMSILFLSYLWGMETLGLLQCNNYQHLRSYPTYEEWKPYIKFCKFFFMLSSYPTYEEWKLLSPPNSFWEINTGSYPTYEEWKQLSENYKEFKNWSSYPTYEEWKPSSISSLSYKKLPFLSYLWGMETSYPSLYPHCMSCKFLSYLWGMETSLPSIDWRFPRHLVLILPMRNGNNTYNSCHWAFQF